MNSIVEKCRMRVKVDILKVLVSLKNKLPKLLSGLVKS